MNFIMSILGAAILFTVGLIIGFWIEVLSTPPLPNGFTECVDCGPKFSETARFWQGKKR